MDLLLGALNVSFPKIISFAWCHDDQDIACTKSVKESSFEESKYLAQIVGNTVPRIQK